VLAVAVPPADLMYATIDAAGADKPMQRNHSPAAGLYFVAIQIVCHFFMLEIFTGVIIDNFSKMKSLHHVRDRGCASVQCWVCTVRHLLAHATFLCVRFSLRARTFVKFVCGVWAFGCGL
jgi:hypothetical protein